MTRTPPTAAFRHRAFLLFQIARLLAVVAFQMQGVAVGWQVYELTGRPIDLGYVGLAQFLPSIVLWLLAGSVADRFDRRRVVIACHSLLCAASAALAVVAAAERPSVVLVFAILVVIGTARAFSGPASQALLPNLVPREHFPNAVAWNSSIFHVAVVLGPALGGLFYGGLGPSRTFALSAVLELSAIALLASMASLTPRPRRTRTAGPGEQTPSELMAGLRFVWQNKLILGAITLDLFAVLLGGAVALLPIFARDVLGVGPVGLGTLRSAPAVGATLVAVLLAYRPLERRAGVVLYACVALFGLSTIVFGLSTSFLLSLGALAVAGAADMVSVFVRHSLVQLRTPDEMRGRVSAINLLFIGVSNEVGEFESGLTAQWLGAVPAVLVGGAGTCLVVLFWIFLFPELLRVRRLPTYGSDQSN